MAIDSDPGRKPVPPTPSGMSLRRFGQKVMKWGHGERAARERLKTLTRDELVRGGVTIEIAREWRDFYFEESTRNPKNPSARARAELMEKAIDLLSQESHE